MSRSKKRRRNKFQQNHKVKGRTMPPQIIASSEQQAQMENQRRSMIAQKKFELACDIYARNSVGEYSEERTHDIARMSLRRADVLFLEAGIIKVEESNETSD